VKLEKPPGLVNPKEKTLFAILATLAVIAWIALVLGTLGAMLLIIFFVWILYLFVQSRFVSYLLGTGAVVTKEQFPDLYKMYEDSCAKLKLEKKPTMILIHMDGMFNAFATSFLRKHYVVLLSEVVDALKDEPEAIKFYIGHELGHVSRNHIFRDTFLSPVSWLPILGAAYFRACELTCDRHGLSCCDNEESAVKAMSALAVGRERWKSISISAYLKQKDLLKGFWMSFHEIISDYPWLVRRAASLHQDPEKSSIPKRNLFSWILGAFVPRFTVTSVIFLYFVFIFFTAYNSYQRVQIQKKMKIKQINSMTIRKNKR